MGKVKEQPKWTCFTQGTVIEFEYFNSHGVPELRRATFIGVDYGWNSQNTYKQFFLRCEAHDRDMAERSFAINRIKADTLCKVDMTW